MSKKQKIIICSSIGAVVIVLILAIFSILNRTYTVSFATDSGTIIESQKIKKGDTAIKPIDPEKEGYEFDGWYLNNEKYYFDTEVKSDIELKARWIEKVSVETVTVTFDTDGGNKIDSVEVEIGKKVGKPTDPVKDGYVFVEWLLDNNSFNFDNAIVNDITLVASYKKSDKDTVIVTFDSNGGSTVANQTIKKGEKAKAPKNPTRSGYTFNGWYLNNKKFNFNTTLDSNITLKANWTKNQVTENNNNSNTGNTNNPTPTPSEPVPVVKYTVTFKSNGGSSVATQTIEAGGKATKPANPTRNGYKFVGWMHNRSTYNFDSPVTGNLILEAAWELIPVPDVYTVSLELINGETNIPERKAIVYKNGSVITVSQLLDQDGKVLGKYISSLGAIRVNKSQYDSATSLKVKLQDGTIVSATKK